MAVSERTDSRDSELKRLRDELQQTQLRLEEVTNYYRGEIEAVRRRSEDQLLQVQADEAAKRRRAEEQVTQLNAELKSARSEADKAKRRYQELLNRIEAIEAESREAVRAERDRYEDSARAAWQTAEQEVERLNSELAELQRELAAERSERERVVQDQSDREAAYERRDAERQQLITRLKRALKASEQRREALEAQGAQATSERPVASGTAAQQRAAEQRVDVDPSAGWGRFQLGEGDDLAEEFLLIDADRSFQGADNEGSQSANSEHSAATTGAADGGAPSDAGPREAASDDEAERLIMGVAVDQKVAQRQAGEASESSGEAPASASEAAARPRCRQPPMPEAELPWWRRHPVWLAAGVVTAMVGVAMVLVVLR